MMQLIQSFFVTSMLSQHPRHRVFEPEVVATLNTDEQMRDGVNEQTRDATVDF